MNYTVKKGNYSGVIEIPPSKSDSQRALLIAALGNKTSVLRNVGKSDDECTMIKNIVELGAEINWATKKTLTVKGHFNSTFLTSLNCNESGLGFRLLTSIASLKQNKIELTGNGSLINRDQSFFDLFYPQMGVIITSNNKKLPITITGPLKNGNYSVDGGESSQYISGLLIALSQTEGKTILKVKNSISKPYINMTINTLEAFGVKINETEKDIYEIIGVQPILKTDYTIDGDWSSASYWLVASALGLDVSVTGLSMSSLQADKAILNALMTANCQVNNSEKGISINGKERLPLNFDATHCPDLFPALTTYAALTEGVSSITGVHRLTNKESNRAEVLKYEFKKVGVTITIKDDTMFIEGTKNIRPATVSSQNDHRIAMCLAILSATSSANLIIENSNAVSKSYPDFWGDLDALREDNEQTSKT